MSTTPAAAPQPLHVFGAPSTALPEDVTLISQGAEAVSSYCAKDF